MLNQNQNMMAMQNAQGQQNTPMPISQQIGQPRGQQQGQGPPGGGGPPGMTGQMPPQAGGMGGQPTPQAPTTNPITAAAQRHMGGGMGMGPMAAQQGNVGMSQQPPSFMSQLQAMLGAQQAGQGNGDQMMQNYWGIQQPSPYSMGMSMPQGQPAVQPRFSEVQKRPKI